MFVSSSTAHSPRDREAGHIQLLNLSTDIVGLMPVVTMPAADPCFIVPPRLGHACSTRACRHIGNIQHERDSLAGRLSMSRCSPFSTAYAALRHRRQLQVRGPSFELRRIRWSEWLGVTGAIASEVQENRRPVLLPRQPPRRLAGHDSKAARAEYSPHC